MRRSTQQISLFDEIIADNFAGGGGDATGIVLATGRPVTLAVNHDPDAVLQHKTNHPYTEHYCENVWEINPVKVCAGRKVALAWFSPDCKHHSKARGGKPRDKNIRGLAWVAVRWAATVRPRVIILENVEEFQTWGPLDKNGQPIKGQEGRTFRGFIHALQYQGYTVEWRELRACDFGAPTVRKRFFLIARSDGRPIVWPEPTHGDPNSQAVKTGKLKPWRSAAEVIDWSLPCPSIFDSKEEIQEQYGLKAVRPLADNTLKRAAKGMDKFVIRCREPYIVQCNHSGEFRGQSIHDPMQTITGKHGYGLVTPVITAIGQTGFSDDRSRSVASPLHTTDSKNEACLIAPALLQYHSEQSKQEVRGQAVGRPILTVDAAPRYALSCAFLAKYFGQGVGQPVQGPLHTITTKDREALTLAHIIKFKGDNLGQHPASPLQTITTSIGQFGVIKIYLIKAPHTECLHRWPLIRALLNKYCGYNIAQDEVLILEINGIAYFIADIGLRMLTPRELYDANGFPPDYIIDRDYLGRAYAKSKQVARCGNAVPPPFATALVQANLPELCVRRAITTMQSLESQIAI